MSWTSVTPFLTFKAVNKNAPNINNVVRTVAIEAILIVLFLFKLLKKRVIAIDKGELVSDVQKGGYEYEV